MTQKFYIACGETHGLEWPVFYISKESNLANSTFKFGLLHPTTHTPYEKDVLAFDTVEDAEVVVEQLKQTNLTDNAAKIKPIIRQVLVT